ncbi:hypothetical protein EZV73_26610 [Acidaminobacter sp. JC074]|uniref:hypothetical protein n=1 Tax=Acidaminobacter sp. JC074 TaxID=2530199 RepID=UPI001F10BF3B|nr:hypothetical protein [Acidaminobacter sp. JC074]MCH4891179.1 hypothetical protein [Acidaminobacter sp. JC074]
MGDTKASKVLSLNQLIAKKTQRDQAKLAYKNIESYSLEGELVAKKPDRESLLEYMEAMTNAGESFIEIYGVCKDAVYNSIPVLKEQALQEAYGCVEPDSIVDELFEVEEVIELGTKIIDWDEKNLDQAKADLDEEVEADIKN